MKAISSEACPGRDPGWTSGSREENASKLKHTPAGSGME
jgi:hypothetical protein